MAYITATATAPANTVTAHDRRLREIVKRLVIDLGYLDHYLSEGDQDSPLGVAAASLDTAIDCLNESIPPSDQ